jgi:hypothetical protein
VLPQGVDVIAFSGGMGLHDAALRRFIAEKIVVARETVKVLRETGRSG